VPLWSNFQAQVQPICRIEPRDSQDVEVILSAARLYECHFAVLGGGTSPFRLASNAARGITIDMRRIKEVSFVDGNDSQITVGAGSLWSEVYQALQPRNMSATGTRNSLVGVVGSILGGKLQ
jgi:FAD/FMN-containing dehydrogenase